jgi:hypothetical protein
VRAASDIASSTSRRSAGRPRCRTRPWHRTTISPGPSRRSSAGTARRLFRTASWLRSNTACGRSRRLIDRCQYSWPPRYSASPCRQGVSALCRRPHSTTPPRRVMMTRRRTSQAKGTAASPITVRPTASASWPATPLIPRRSRYLVSCPGLRRAGAPGNTARLRAPQARPPRALRPAARGPALPVPR